MLTRLRSLKLSLLLAYALALQGVAVTAAAAATSLTHNSGTALFAWCLPAPAATQQKAAGSPASPPAHHGDCCFGTCAAGAAGFVPESATAIIWPRSGEAYDGAARTAHVVDNHPAHPWSPRAPPVV